MREPLVTVVVPSLNQGRFLDDALASIFIQGESVETFVLDGGSTDNSVGIIKKWEPHLAGWRSRSDGGQADAINEGVASGRAPYVCWLNSDDCFLPGGLRRLVADLESNPAAPMVYGRTWDCDEATQRKTKTLVLPFSEWLMARLCVISQPGTLVRRDVWDALGGLNEALHMAMDYDLWWRVYKRFGIPLLVDEYVAVNRVHRATKTNTLRRKHYEEAIGVVRNHYGRVPMKWWLAWPYAVWFRSRRWR